MTEHPITKPDASPLLLAALNFFPLGIPVGYFLLGQQRKAWVGLAYVWLLMPCGGLGWFVAMVLAYDAYKLGQKLASGESISETESAVDFLGTVPGFR